MWTPTTVENEAEIEKNIITTPTNAGIMQKPISFIFSFFTFTIIFHLYYLIIFGNWQFSITCSILPFILF